MLCAFVSVSMRAPLRIFNPPPACANIRRSDCILPPMVIKPGLVNETRSPAAIVPADEIFAPLTFTLTLETKLPVAPISKSRGPEFTDSAPPDCADPPSANPATGIAISGLLAMSLRAPKLSVPPAITSPAILLSSAVIEALRPASKSDPWPTVNPPIKDRLASRPAPNIPEPLIFNDVATPPADKR